MDNNELLEQIDDLKAKLEAVSSIKDENDAKLSKLTEDITRLKVENEKLILKLSKDENPSDAELFSIFYKK